MNVMYVREGLYMPSTELQVRSMEDKYGKIFDRCVVEDITSTMSLKTILGRDKVYAYLPHCVVDIDSPCEYDASKFFRSMIGKITFVEKFDDADENTPIKTSLSEFLYMYTYSNLQKEKENGALRPRLITLTNKFPFEKCVDENTEAHTDGDYYVYLWETDFCNDVFYVGSGKGDRYAQVGENCRSKDFMTIFNQVETHPYIVSFGMKENEARTLETNIIKEFVKLGFNLVNRKDNPKRSTKITDSTPEKEKNYMAYWQ